MIARAWLAVAVIVACSAPPKPERFPIRVSSDREEPYVLWLEAREGETSTEDRVAGYAPAAGTWWYGVRIREAPPTPFAVDFSLTLRSGNPQLALIDERGAVLEARRSKSRGIPTHSIVLPESTQHPRRFLLRLVTSKPTRFFLEARMSWSKPPEPIEPVLEFESHPPCTLDKPDFKNPDCCQAHCGLGRRGCRGTILSGDKKFVEISLGMKDHIPRGSTGWLFQPDVPPRSHRHASRSRIIVMDVAEDKALVQLLSPDQVDPSVFAKSYVMLDLPDQCIRRSRP